MKLKWIIAAVITISAVTIIACNKVDFETISKFNVKLAASGQTEFEQVNIEIDQVKVNYTDTTWVLLNTPRQVYNLLDYNSGLDTVIANGNIPATSIVKRLKVKLGTNHSVKFNGKQLPLVTAENGGEITLNVERKLNRYIENLILVFDPANSISVGLNGGYQFKPAIYIK